MDQGKLDAFICKAISEWGAAAGVLLVLLTSFARSRRNPSGAAAHVLQTIKPKRGTWMIVQPFAHGKVEENLNRVGRVFYSASTFVCVPASLNEKGPGLGCSGRPGEIERKS